MNETGLDKIHIRDLAARCVIGVYGQERSEKQDVVINITLYADLRRACQSDCIADTVDYKAIKKKALTLVERSSFFLVEKLAERVAAACLEDAGVTAVRVRIAKPGALRFARTVEVEVFRRREADGSVGERSVRERDGGENGE